MAIKRAKYTFKSIIKPAREQVPTRIARKPGKVMHCRVCGRVYRMPLNAGRSRLGVCSRSCALRKDWTDRGL